MGTSPVTLQRPMYKSPYVLYFLRISLFTLIWKIWKWLSVPNFQHVKFTDALTYYSFIPTVIKPFLNKRKQEIKLKNQLGLYKYMYRIAKLTLDKWPEFSSASIPSRSRTNLMRYPLEHVWYRSVSNILQLNTCPAANGRRKMCTRLDRMSSRSFYNTQTAALYLRVCW